MENKIMNKLIAMRFIDVLELNLAFQECCKENKKDDALYNTIKNAIKNIKEYHNID